MISLILGLIIGALSVIFALQNVFSVTVSFLTWNLTASLALIISIALLLGLVVGILFTLPESIKNSFAISRLSKENKKLVDELEKEKSENPVIVETREVESPITEETRVL